MSISDTLVRSLEPAVLARLLDVGETLPEQLRREILGLGSGAVPGLVTLLEDESLDEEEAPGEGWVRIHAAGLLGDLGDAAAVEPLLRAIDQLDMDDLLFDTIGLALARFGGALVEPALSVLAAEPSSVVREAVCVALGECGVRDERIFTQLKSLFGVDPGLGAVVFGGYGDTRALPQLEQTIRFGELDADPRFARCDLDDLVGAYRQLAGDIPGDLEAVVAERHESLREAVALGGYADEGSEEESDEDPEEMSEFAVSRQLERHPEKPWIWAATCSDPECDCRIAKLLVAKRSEDIKAAVARVGDGWEDKEAPPQLPPELASAVVALDVDIDSGAVTVPAWAELTHAGAAEALPVVGEAAPSLQVSEATEAAAPPSVAMLIDGQLLDELHDQWLAGKGFDSVAVSRRDLDELASWKRGELLPYHVVFSGVRLDYYDVGDATYVLLEHHCPTPNCTCDQVVLDWQRLGEKTEPAGEARWAPGCPPVFEGKNKTLLRGLWARFVERYPDFEGRLKERSRQLRAVGEELLARARPRREEVQPRTWVSGSKKGRKGAPNKRCQKPRR